MPFVDQVFGHEINPHSLVNEEKVAKHSQSMLTRIRSPAKLPCHMYKLWLVSCSLLDGVLLWSTGSRPVISVSVKLQFFNTDFCTRQPNSGAKNNTNIINSCQYYHTDFSLAIKCHNDVFKIYIFIWTVAFLTWVLILLFCWEMDIVQFVHVHFEYCCTMLLIAKQKNVKQYFLLKQLYETLLYFQYALIHQSDARTTGGIKHIWYDLCFIPYFFSAYCEMSFCHAPYTDSAKITFWTLCAWNNALKF